MSPALHKIARELRSALLGGDQVRAELLVSEYSGAVRELWEALPESDRATSSIPRQAAELLAWARDMTLVRRAMAAEQLAVVQKASRYSATRSAVSPRPAVQFRG
jgi:hypothetical protein